MPTVPVLSRPRFFVAVVAALGVIVAASAVTATVATPGRVLALPGASESTVVAVEPTRVLDTRFNVGLTGAFQHGVSRKLTVTGSIATYFEPTDTREDKIVVPVGATGVVLNVTAVGPTGGGFVSVRPGDATGFPSTSNINIVPGQTVPNAVTVAVPTAGTGVGQIDITYGSTAGNTVNIIVDIVGYTTNTGLIDLTNRVIALETSVKGDPGPQGEPGAQGEAGPQGDAGPKGDSGFIGDIKITNGIGPTLAPTVSPPQAITIGSAEVSVVRGSADGTAHMQIIGPLAFGAATYKLASIEYCMVPGGPGSPGSVNNFTVEIQGLVAATSVEDSTARTTADCFVLDTSSLAAASAYDARWTVGGDAGALVSFRSVTSTWTPA